MGLSPQETKQQLSELFQRFNRERTVFETPPNGVTPNEARTLLTIAKCAQMHESARPGQVAEFMHATPSALSQTLKVLEEKGLIERRRASADFRGITLELTEEGEAVAAKAHEIRERHMEAALAYLGPEDAEHLVRILKKFIAYHDEMPGCHAVECEQEHHEGGAPCA